MSELETKDLIIRSCADRRTESPLQAIYNDDNRVLTCASPNGSKALISSI